MNCPVLLEDKSPNHNWLTLLASRRIEQLLGDEREPLEGTFSLINVCGHPCRPGLA
jgi:hypothetical protein